MLSSSVMLETSVFLKAMLKQMLFQGKSEQLKLWVIFQQSDWTIKPHAVFITADEVKTDSSAEKQPITVIRESEPAANTNIHRNTFQYSAMFEPLSPSPHWRLRTITQYFSIGSLWRIWK